jgi:hypothetical protein
MTEQSYFRGYNSIKEVADYLEPLADWMEKYKPGTKVLTLRRQDFDLIQRWPKAAGLLKFSQAPDKSISYRGFTLKYDKKPPRYSKHEAA